MQALLKNEDFYTKRSFRHQSVNMKKKEILFSQYYDDHRRCFLVKCLKVVTISTFVCCDGVKWTYH